MTKVSSLGYPRLGENREWKKLIEAYWAGKVSKNDLFAGAKELRLDFLKKQLNAGLDLIPVGDFSLYDHILDLSVQFNIIPKRFAKEPIDIDLYFAIARGNKENVASSMKKWFNTNYHYIVPEWSKQRPKLNNNRLLDLYLEAREVEIRLSLLLLVPLLMWLCQQALKILQLLLRVCCRSTSKFLRN